MPRVKQWSTEDRERALQWMERRARINGRSGPDLVELSTIVEPEAVAERLRGLLPEAEWKRLLSALRQRKHASNSSSKASASTGEPTAAAACRQCAELRAELDKALAMIERYKALDSEQVRQLTEMDNKLRLHQRAAKIEENRLKRELAEVKAEYQTYVEKVTQRGKASVKPIEVKASTSEHAMQRAAELRASGQSFRQIAAALNAESFPTRSGRGQWQPGSVEKALRGA